MSKKSFLRQQITSMTMTLVVVFCSTVVSAVMWFQQSFEETVPTTPYEMRLELVQDLEKPFVGENLLWSSGILGVPSLDTVVDLPAAEKGHLIVSNVYGYEETVLYEVEIIKGTKKVLDASLNATAKKNFLKKGTSTVFKDVNLKGEGNEPVRFVLRTALADQSIYTASTLEDLTKKEYPAKSVVYLNNDLIIKGDVVFEHYYPNVNLGGHTFSCMNLTLSAPKEAYASMSIGNGVLKVGEKQYTTQDTISCVGEGNVILDLYDLQ